MRSIRDIPEDKRKLIDNLKKNIGNELPPALREDNIIYYRFLKANGFDLKKAESVLLKHAQFRKKYKVDDILETYVPPKNINEYFPLSFLGYDKEGSIIYYADLGQVDVKGLISVYTFDQLFRHFVFHLESLFKKMKEKNNEAERLPLFVGVINMDKFSLFQSTYKKGIESFYEGLRVFLENYPEILKCVYIINASFYFHFAYALIKPIFDENISKKLHICGYDDWKDSLLERIDAGVLPAFLGGTRTDDNGNPMCNSFIVHGKKVPEELYSTKRKSMVKDKDVKKLTIQRSSFSEIEIDIKERNTNIEWEFETKTKDIGFGLYYKNLDSKDISEAIIPLERIDTALASEVGMFKCNQIGTYIIVFDNSYSWLTSKELYYRVKTVPANN